MTTSTYNIDFLKKLNTHSRDRHISFYEPTHTYTILNDLGSKYTSVTTLIHTLFEQFNADNIIRKMMLSKKWPTNKYFGMTTQEIKNVWEINRVNAANMGTQLHYLIECFMNLGQFISNNSTNSTNSTNNAHSFDFGSYNLGQLLQYYFANPQCLDGCKSIEGE